MKARLVALTLVAAFIGAGASPIVLAPAATTPTPLEQARATVVSAEASVKADEAALTSAKSTLASASNLVASLTVEPPKEEPKVEPAPSAVVSSAPLGPATPAGGWHVAFADGFGKPVGGGDTFWAAKTNAHGCCNNPNETSSEAPSAVRWSEANGLELRCEGLVCSGVSTSGFTYQLGRGASYVFEVVAKLPDNTFGGEDPAFWSISTSRWPPELDLFEYWGWHKPNPVESVGGFPVYKSNGLGANEQYWTPGSTIWTAYHHYTTVVEGSRFSEYIDGKPLDSGFTQAVNTDAMNLILVHAIREYTNPRNTSFDVRSVAVYEDAAHAGQFVSGGGIAPGTIVK